MQNISSEFFENLPHDRFDIVSKDIFGTFTEDLLRKFTKIPGLKFVDRLASDLQNNLLIWQWILSGLIVDPTEIRHLLAGLFSFKSIIGLSNFLNFLFQVRCGFKPHLPVLGVPNWTKKRRTKSPCISWRAPC